MSEVPTGVPRSWEIAPPLGPYSRPMPRALWWSWGVAISYERGTPVPLSPSPSVFLSSSGMSSPNVSEPYDLIMSSYMCPHRFGATELLCFVYRSMCFVYRSILGGIRFWVGPRKEHRLSLQDLTRVDRVAPNAQNVNWRIVHWRARVMTGP